MAHRFSELTFTEGVQTIQKRFGSYDRAEKVRQRMPDFDQFTDRESQFIAARNSFYMATVTEDGWPYIQHRGGEAGFLKLIDEQTLLFANLSGNGQYQSLGNLLCNDRVALFLVDYPNRRRLKILGRATLVMVDEVRSLLEKSRSEEVDGYLNEAAESYLLIHLEAFDWNCSQHITPRFTEVEAVELFNKNKE